MKKLHELVTKIEPPNWVCGILALIVLFRIPSFLEPYYYGDEMIYLTLGNAVRNGLTLYKQIHDNKPPLLYLTAALAGNLFWFKAILCFWMLGTTIAFWHLVKTLFPNNPSKPNGGVGQKISVIIFAILTTIPLLEGQIVNAELFLIGPIIIANLILLSKPSYKNIFLSGIFFAVAALFKVPAIFDIPVVIIFWIISLQSFNFKNLVDIFKKSLVLFLGFIIPIFITFIWYFLKGALADYIKAAFLQNIGYISSWGGAQNQSFVVKHGPLLIRAGIVLIGLIILRVYSKKLSKPFMIATIWLLTSLFAVTLSERPYPHYLIQAVPSISILIGILVSSEKFEQVLTVFPLTLALLVPVYYKFWYYPSTPYYERFIEYSSGKLTKWQFFNEFDASSSTNYDISEKVTKLTTANDKIFVWGEEAPTIYALTHRLPVIKYAANYHITDYSSLSEVGRELAEKLPTVIVILEDPKNFQDLTNLLTKKYIQIERVGASNTTGIWHLLSN